MSEAKFDRSLLRSFLGIGLNEQRIDDGLLKATDEQLWDSLACLHEPEFEKLHPLNLDKKFRAILERRAAQKFEASLEQTEARNRRRWLVTTVIAVASVLLGVVLNFLCRYR
jgi:hypothetical protein